MNTYTKNVWHIHASAIWSLLSKFAIELGHYFQRNFRILIFDENKRLINISYINVVSEVVCEQSWMAKHQLYYIELTFSFKLIRSIVSKHCSRIGGCLPFKCNCKQRLISTYSYDRLNVAHTWTIHNFIIFFE